MLNCAALAALLVPRLVDKDTLLWRQVHPSWVQGNRATSQAFRPTAKDEGRLSVYDSVQIGVEDAWRHYTVKLSSYGVLAVTYGECEEQGLVLIPDPKPDMPAHALLDFRSFSVREAKTIATMLASVANQRGWQYRPPRGT